jgi:hypothetical protein
MAFSIEIVRTIPLFPLGVFIQWDLKGAKEAGLYSFTIYRAGSRIGPWDQLSTALNTYNYTDIITPSGDGVINQLSLSRGIYYRIVVSGPSGNAEAISTVEPKLSGRNRLLKRKILRDQSVRLRKLNGVEVVVFKRMHWGQRCDKCFDTYTQTVLRSNCTTCFGTSFSPGYFNPILTLSRNSTPAVNTQLTEQGNSDLAVSNVTLLDVPYIERDDILVFVAENRRFIVQKQIPARLQNVTVFQQLQVGELPRSAIEYRLTADLKRLPALF